MGIVMYWKLGLEIKLNSIGGEIQFRDVPGSLKHQKWKHTHILYGAGICGGTTTVSKSRATTGSLN